MTSVSELELPELDLTGADLAGERYHERLAKLATEGELPWLAKSPLTAASLTGLAISRRRHSARCSEEARTPCSRSVTYRPLMP